MSGAVSPALLLGAALAISLGAMLGALVPLRVKVTPRHHLIVLGFAAGVMFGAALLHMLPEAVKRAGLAAFPFTLLGFFAVLLLERFIPDHHADDGHHHPPGEHPEPLGLPTFLALSLHTLTDGLALGVALEGDAIHVGVLAALALHQIPAAISLCSILLGEGYTRTRTLLMTLCFALMVPVGALLYLLLRTAVDLHALAPRALAFSAGTFLHLALADLLPQVHREPLLRRAGGLALALGVGAMWALRLTGVD